MKFYAACLLSALLLALPSYAQRRGGGGLPSPNRPSANVPPGFPSAPTSPLGGPVFITGKVVLDDGTELTESANIVTLCRSQKKVETHTDSHGGFSFQIGTRNQPPSGDGVSDADSSWTNQVNSRSAQRDWRDCEIQATLPGYISELVPLSARMSGSQNSDIGHLVLRRMQHVDGTSISVTTASAPGPAKKAFEKGREQEQKGKWEEALKSFEKAVEVYPKFAVAWYELGRVHQKNNDLPAAKNAFQKAADADGSYVSPLDGLAGIAAHEKQWQELVNTTAKLVSLNAMTFPNAWFLNGVGHFYLQEYALAEKSARQGLKLDEAHNFPKLEYLLGMALAQERQYVEAAQHMRAFIQQAKKPEEIQDAQKQLSTIEQLSASAVAVK
ncbi:MAG TPA: tetratricopeptide repeat protein [Terriglobales bacterium]|nr:tetratricopeptide repeat protein [Terriglobales bacterium]